MTARATALVIAAAAIAATAPAGAAPADNLLERLWAAAKGRLDLRLEAPRVPPAPVTVTWAPRPVAQLDLGAPLLDLTAGDLDADGAAELVALTERHVIVLRRGPQGAVTEVGRRPLPEALPLTTPREPVGAVIVDRGSIVARTSGVAYGARYRLEHGNLVERESVPGFPLCSDAAVDLTPGRTTFDGAAVVWQRAETFPAVPAGFHAARCALELVDPEGAPRPMLAAVSAAGALTLQRLVRCGAPPCRGAPSELAALETPVGYAFAITDLDNDGRVELVTAAYVAPGDPDQIAVYELDDGGGFARVHQSREIAGGVAGIAAADLDGDGDRDAVAVVRSPGNAQVELWALTR